MRFVMPRHIRLNILLLLAVVVAVEITLAQIVAAAAAVRAAIVLQFQENFQAAVLLPSRRLSCLRAATTR